MPGIVWKTVAFVRWLCSPEPLPAPPDSNREETLRKPGFVRRMFAGEELDAGQSTEPQDLPRPQLLRWILSSEQLPSVTDESPGPVGGTWRFWRSIAGTEELPERETARIPAISQTGFLRRLFLPEVCPQAPAPPSLKRKGFFHDLLSPEVCPQARPPAHRRRRGFLRWVLSGDEL